MENKNELYAALAKAQAEMRNVYQDGFNSHFKNKYAKLPDIIDVGRPALTKYGLCALQQLIMNDEGDYFLKTILGHTSGQSIESIIKMLPLTASYSEFGKQLTYLRKFSYASLIGLVGGEGDDDDDGAEAAKKADAIKKSAPKKSIVDIPEEKTDLLTLEQLDIVETALDGFPTITDKMLKYYKIDSISQLPRNKVQHALDNITHIKRREFGQ